MWIPLILPLHQDVFRHVSLSLGGQNWSKQHQWFALWQSEECQWQSVGALCFGLQKTNVPMGMEGRYSYHLYQSVLTFFWGL